MNHITLGELKALPKDTKLCVDGGMPTTAQMVLAFVNNPHFTSDQMREDYLTARRYKVVH